MSHRDPPPISCVVCRPHRKRRQFVRFRCLFSLLSTVKSTSPFPPPLPNLTSIQLIVARVDSPLPPISGCLDRLRDAGGPCRRRISRPFRVPVGCRSGLDPRTGLEFLDLLPLDGGARGAVPGLHVGFGGLGGGGLPDLWGLRRAPLARRLLPRRPVPPRPTRLRGNQLLAGGSLDPKCPCQVTPRVVVCNGWDVSYIM